MSSTTPRRLIISADSEHLTGRRLGWARRGRPGSPHIATARGSATCDKLKKERGGSMPRADLLSFDEVIARPGSFTGPLEVLELLTPEARARFTTEVIAVGAGSPTWAMAHETSPGKYPKFRVGSPVLWRLRHEGRVSTSMGVTAVPDAVGPSFGELAAVLPVARCTPEAASFLRIPDRPEDVPATMWRVALERAAAVTEDAPYGSVLTAVVAAGIHPASIRCRRGGDFESRPPAEVRRRQQHRRPCQDHPAFDPGPPGAVRQRGTIAGRGPRHGSHGRLGPHRRRRIGPA